MPSSLTNVNISDTYIGVLHASGQQLPSTSRALIYDGYGNPSALSVGVSGNGVEVTGTSKFTMLTATSITASTGTFTNPVVAANTPKAWAVATGGGTILSQYNVSEVLRSSTGLYRVTLTDALPTADYCVTISMSYDNTSNKVIFSHVAANPAPTDAVFWVKTSFLNTGTTAAAFDPATLSLTVHHV